MSNTHNDTAMDAYWMPFTSNREFKNDPRMLATAKGMYYTTTGGDQVMDGISGLWCCNAGHCHPHIVKAIQEQAAELDYSTAFQIGYPATFRLAERLARLAPEGIDSVFFTNSGSESVDTALKMALGYHHARGEGHRTRLIGRQRGYHGSGFGGTSIGGIGNNRKAVGSLLAGTLHFRDSVDLERQSFSRGQPQWGAELADDLERVIVTNHPSTIAAVIVEPFAGSAGVLLPPVGYLERLREITRRHGILLIFDEVISAFGRLGYATAAERFGISPDIICVAKGLTSGTVPMGAVLVGNEIRRTIIDSSPSGIEFFHGYTYSGHPLATAAAHATLDVYADEGLFNRVQILESIWEDAIHSLSEKPNVIDIRNLGLVGAIELEPRPENPSARAADIFKLAFDNGLLVRATADIIALAPPLIIQESEVSHLIETLGNALDQVR